MQFENIVSKRVPVSFPFLYQFNKKRFLVTRQYPFQFDIVERNLLMFSLLSLFIIHMLPIIFPFIWFYREIHFDTKYFILAYSISAVSTLFYYTYMYIKKWLKIDGLGETIRCKTSLNTKYVKHYLILLSEIVTAAQIEITNLVPRKSILCNHINRITHWGRDKMADIFQTTVSNGFSWVKVYEGCSFGYNDQYPGIGSILSEWMMASLQTHICVTRPQWVNWP